MKLPFNHLARFGRNTNLLKEFEQYLLFVLFLFLKIGIANAQPYKHCLDDGIVKWSVLAYQGSDSGIRSTEIAAYDTTHILTFYIPGWTYTVSYSHGTRSICLSKEHTIPPGGPTEEYTLFLYNSYGLVETVAFTSKHSLLVY
jgi:hypothetical protein